MRKIDKLLLKSFLGPFFLTFVVVVFILLMQHMLKYMDDILGKDLGILVISELLMYFAVFMTPVALPLAVLLSSLMTYGNLGEHFELTAIKGAGISLIRTLRPLFFFVCLVTVFAFLSNNYLVPKAALKAYSLLYDIKQKKPSLDLKEGTFYDGIPGYSIKVEKKFPDGITLKNLIIYNHAKKIGNSQIIMADSGKMETILNSRYLSLELFNGNRYAEGQSTRSIQDRNKGEPGEFVRSSFDRSQYIFSLSSFDLDQTPDELFAGNKMMKDITKLRVDIDSMNNSIIMSKYTVYKSWETINKYHMKDIWKVPEDIKSRHDYLDSMQRVKADRMDSLRKVENQRVNKRRSDDLKQFEFNSESRVIPKTSKSKRVVGNRNDSIRQKLISASEKNPPIPSRSRNSAKVPKELKTSASPKIRPAKTYTEVIKQDTGDIQQRLETIRAESQKSDSVKQVSINPEYTISQDNEDKQVGNGENSFENQLAKVNEYWKRKNIESRVLKLALSRTRQTKTRMANELRKIESLEKDIAGHIIKLHQKYSHAIACMIMFVIGAPLGAIIKKGGLGVPVLISIFFFIIFYVLVISGQNWGEEGAMDPVVSVWVADMVLLPFGILFMIQAKNDARLLEMDFYNVAISKVRNYFVRKKDKE